MRTTNNDDFKYPANRALTIVDGVLTQELHIHRFDDRGRSKAQLFAIGGPLGKQFAIVLGNTDVRSGDHPAQQTRVLLEKCNLPAMKGIRPVLEPYTGSRVTKQSDSKLSVLNQVSCLVADESSLEELLHWYAADNRFVKLVRAGEVDTLEYTRIEKAASDAGFDLSPLRDGAWLVFRSTACRHETSVSPQLDGRYRVQFSNVEWGRKVAEDCSYSTILQEGAWPARIDNVVDYDALHHLLLRAVKIGRLSAGEGLRQFQFATRHLPETTEAERLVVQRVGQEIFRSSLIEYWNGRCAVTGLQLAPLLRASHIKPWSKCKNDEDRLNVFNGLLLAPHVDALFDGGWITFSDVGAMQVSHLLPADAYLQLGVQLKWRLNSAADSHKPYLAYHRAHVFRAVRARSIEGEQWRDGGHRPA
ncbi:HNH endonuclease [Paraburkholderia sediminicola]|uniref:HNH endonuclease n=1 Tax=Paraburkholderia sediminicola TaxID=458836 RepID=UPI0038BBD853